MAGTYLVRLACLDKCKVFSKLCKRLEVFVALSLVHVLPTDCFLDQRDARASLAVVAWHGRFCRLLLYIYLHMLI